MPPSVDTAALAPASVIADRRADGHDFVLVCPVCGFDYNHAQAPFVISGEYLNCRDDGDVGGLVVPFSGECGHRWGIGFANHKGRQIVAVISPSDLAMLERERCQPNG